MRHILHLAWNVKVHACKNFLGNDPLPNRCLTWGEEKKITDDNIHKWGKWKRVVKNVSLEDVEGAWNLLQICITTYSETRSCFRDARKRVILNWSKSIRMHAWISHPCGTRLMHSIGVHRNNIPGWRKPVTIEVTSFKTRSQVRIYSEIRELNLPLQKTFQSHLLVSCVRLVSG